MTRYKLAVCDSDSSYVGAFAAYLMEHLESVDISTYTSTEEFMESGEERFDVGILSGEFLRAIDEKRSDNVAEKLYLCDDRIAGEYEHLPMVYKYQSMEIVEEMLRRMQMRGRKSQWMEQDITDRVHITGIYSPISHELQMPFGLALCQIYKDLGRVLYVDIEELSIMQSLMSRDGGRNMQDFFFYMRQDDKINIGDFISSFMGVDYIRPFNNPEELGEIDEECWEKLFELLAESGYERIVVLFGRAIKGFAHMLSACEELIILSKQGEYYQKSTECFRMYLRRLNVDVEAREISLPMSAGNLAMSNFVLEELIQGNLGMYVRRQMANNVRGVANGVA